MSFNQRLSIASTCAFEDIGVRIPIRKKESPEPAYIGVKLGQGITAGTQVCSYQSMDEIFYKAEQFK